MSFDRPGMPRPGQKANEVEINEALAGDGVELTDGELDALDRPGGVSEGPVPNPPRRPGDVVPPADDVPVAVDAAEPVDEVPVVVETAEPADGVPEAVEAAEPVDDPAHEDPAREPQG